MIDRAANGPLGPLLLIFAHPDDEAFGCAGLMAAATEAGSHVTLICATRGEMGESAIPNLDDPELLGAVREEELRTAAAAVGVSDVRLLDYRDSGMPGTPANNHPRALANASEELLAARLVTALRHLQPATVVTFGPDGIYGHPDHLMVHRAAVAASTQAGDPAFRPELGGSWQTNALYFSAVPRDELLAMLEQRGNPTNGMPAEMKDQMGTAREEIDTWIDVSPWSEQKRQALIAHFSQTGEGGPLAAMSEEQLRERLGRESYVHVPLPWDAHGADVIGTIAARHPYHPS